MGKTRLFGTDGIRGVFGRYPLTEQPVTALGRQLAATLAAGDGAQPLVILGGDTRASTPQLCRWLAAGLEAGGARWRYAGVLPTPGVSWLVRHLGAACGVAVSASHNPHPDNGIKLLSGDGFKWEKAREAALEERLLADEAPAGEPGPEPEAEAELAAAYLDGLAASLPAGEPLAGLSMVVDAGNGAASPHAAPLLRRLGARVELLHAAPDGTNINRGCGSTDPQVAAEAMRQGNFDLGVTFDGDADRVILVDELGQVRDGDAILYLWASALAAAGRLTPPAIVATSMSNLGLERALARRGIEVVRCGVGDRQVVETLKARGLLLGGEQSGHIVHLGLASTGDGLLTALQVAHLLVRAGQPLSQLLAGFKRYPQILLNVEVERKPELATLPRVQAAAREVEERLGGDGRLVLRYSGTEPLARIMIEGPDQAAIEALAGELAQVIEEELS
jgi:phosphoglucosamine mutase